MHKLTTELEFNSPTGRVFFPVGTSIREPIDSDNQAEVSACNGTCARLKKDGDSSFRVMIVGDRPRAISIRSFK